MEPGSAVQRKILSTPCSPGRHLRQEEATNQHAERYEEDEPSGWISKLVVRRLQ